MDEKQVSFIAFESVCTRLERTNRRLWILCILLIILLFGTNLGWVLYESQFQTETTSIEASQDGSGINIVGGGDVDYGAESQDH